MLRVGGQGRVGLLGAILVLVLGATIPVQADGLPQKGTVSLGMRSGYMTSSRGIDWVPINLHLGYTLFEGKKWIIPKGALEIATEPFASVVTHVDNSSTRSASIEAGLMLPVVTYYFDLGLPIYPYIEGGLGALYQDYKGFSTGGGFSFTEMAGGGLSYFLNDHLSLNIGYRFRHVSNASIYNDNRSINSNTIMAGFSYLIPAQ